MFQPLCEFRISTAFNIARRRGEILQEIAFRRRCCCSSVLAEHDTWKYLQSPLSSVHSYTLRVVGNGIKAQAANPEVKVKEGDPVINQIIDKLKHINQVSLFHSTYSLQTHVFLPTFLLLLLEQSLSIPWQSMHVRLWIIKCILLSSGFILRGTQKHQPWNATIAHKAEALYLLPVNISHEQNIYLYHLS